MRRAIAWFCMGLVAAGCVACAAGNSPDVAGDIVPSSDAADIGVSDHNDATDAEASATTIDVPDADALAPPSDVPTSVDAAHDAPTVEVAPPPAPTAIGVYAWGFDESSYPGTPDRLNWSAARIAALGARAIRVVIGASDPYRVNPPGAFDLTATAMSSAYRTLFSNPAFDTFLLTTYTTDDQASTWTGGYTAAQQAAEQSAIDALGEYLLTTYSGKTFIVLNWEGDNALASSGTDDTAWNGYVNWISSRAAGVTQARATHSTSTSHLYSGLEFNLVSNLATGAACDASTTRCVLTYVGSRVVVDYYSYSSYESIGANVTETNLATQLSTDLEFIFTTLQASHPTLDRAHVLLGEFGFARDVPVWGECASARRASDAILAASHWGAGYAIDWQIVDNVPAVGEAYTGFGIFKAGGAPSLSQSVFSAWFARGVPTVTMPATCPAINAGGVVDGVTSTSTIHAGAVVSIYGTDFSATGNTVHIEQDVGRFAVVAGSPNFYESSAQINATLPSGVIAGANVVVYVTRADGVDSNGQLVTVLP